jgi:hypothetical protein
MPILGVDSRLGSVASLAGVGVTSLPSRRSVPGSQLKLEAVKELIDEILPADQQAPCKE